MTARSSAATGRDRVGLLAVALLASAASLYVEVGPRGVAVAVIGVGIASVTRGVYGVALHHLGAVALLSAPSVIGITLLETAAVFLLVADVSPSHRLVTGALAVPVVVILAVGVVTFAEGRGLQMAALALIVVVTLGSYLIHRYGRVRLGLTAGGTEP